MKKFLILALLIFAVSFHVEASRLDSYREILLSNSYTIKYTNVTPAPRVTNKDRVELYGKSGLAAESNDFLTNKPKDGVITADGQNKYEEVGGEVDGKQLYMCRLSKNGEDFFFTKYKNKESERKWKYVGTRRNRVVANDKNYIAEILENESYGDADMSRLINAILPNSNENSQQAEYKFVAQGEIEDEDDNYNFYEDYRADLDSGKVEIVRYYFKDNELKKIASASLDKTPSGEDYVRRYIIEIEKFSPVPEENLLQLPKGVKDETKRKKSKEA
ncbi:MAG: hypothetical protein IJT73_07225 [Selenomonadaceae bacterium]|nr:hypothetical protein [Selenomonadaceae bacterium]